jgi:hypothetical protein
MNNQEAYYRSLKQVQHYEQPVDKRLFRSDNFTCNVRASLLHFHQRSKLFASNQGYSGVVYLMPQLLLLSNQLLCRRFRRSQLLGVLLSKRLTKTMTGQTNKQTNLG